MTTPALTRDTLSGILLAVWLQRAADQTVASPEQHCDALADAILTWLTAPDHADRVAAAIEDPAVYVDRRPGEFEPVWRTRAVLHVLTGGDR